MPSPQAPADPPTDSADASVGPEEVRRIAALARLDFTDDEVEALADDLSRLLGYARRLDEVDTDGVEPMAPGAPAAPRHRRPDEPTRPLSQADALEDAPDASDGLFRVPGLLGE